MENKNKEIEPANTRCIKGLIEIETQPGQWITTDQVCDPTNYQYQQMGYKDKKEYDDYIKKAQSLWKSKQRIIQYTDKLNKEEQEAVAQDPELAEAMKKKQDIDKFVVDRINDIITDHRNDKKAREELGIMEE